jgi:hypothetical protein
VRPHTECSGDTELDNSTFRQYLSHQNVSYKARPARRHNKIGFVESGRSSIKLIPRSLALDVRQGVQQISRSVSFSEILAHAVFLRNVLYGSRTLSSFEQARGYQPSLAGPLVAFVTPDLQNSVWNKSHATPCASSESLRYLISWTSPSCCRENRHLFLHQNWEENELGTWVCLSSTSRIFRGQTTA